MSNVTKKTILQTDIEGTVTDLMVKTTADNVYMEDGSTVQDALGGMVLTAENVGCDEISVNGQSAENVQDSLNLFAQYVVDAGGTIPLIDLGVSTYEWFEIPELEREDESPVFLKVIDQSEISLLVISYCRRQYAMLSSESDIYYRYVYSAVCKDSAHCDLSWSEWTMLAPQTDSELSDLSENPVQNKVIKEEFDKHQVESYRDEYGASVELTNINGRGIAIGTRYDLANGPVLGLLWNDNDEPVRVNAIESPLDDYDAANKVYVDDTVNDKVIEAAKSKLLNGLDENGDPIPMEFSDWDSIYDYPKGNAVPAGKSCFIADLASPGDDDPSEFLVFVDKHPCGWNAGMGCYDIDVVGTDTCSLFTYWTDRYGNWYSCCRAEV